MNLLTLTLICTGIAPTTPPTNVEFTIRPDKFSYVRYEFAEGSLKGTAYKQSIGHMQGVKSGMNYTFQSPNTTLTLMAHGDHLMNSEISHYPSGMTKAPVRCAIKKEDDDHGDHGGGHEHLMIHPR